MPKKKSAAKSSAAKNKTAVTGQSVSDYLETVDPERLPDCQQLFEIMQKITGEPGEMWGTSLVGFGRYQYRYESGREGEFFQTGFAPRKRQLVIYLMAGFPEREELLEILGKHSVGKSCLYVKRLDDIHLPTLRRLIRQSVQAVRKKHK